MSGSFLIPGVSQTSTERIAKVPFAALEQLTPKLEALLPSCVPTPFAEAEVMATILGALPSPASAPFTDVVPSRVLRQSYQRWQQLLKAMFLGRVAIENIALSSGKGGADNFGLALLHSRPERSFQGILFSQDVPALNLGGRTRRVVGGLDEHALVWAAPRMQDGDWGTLGNTIHGADEGTALDLISAWRTLLMGKGLWMGDSTGPVWMRGVDRMLEGHKPVATWEQLQPDVRMAGPVRLRFLRVSGEAVMLDVYIPVLSRGHVGKFQAMFRLRPQETEGGKNLVEDRPDGAPGRVGRFVQMTTAARSSLPDGSALVTAREVSTGDALLSGLGSVHVVDPLVTGERWWLQDHESKPGYKTAIYAPLLEQVRKEHGARIKLEEEDVESCPIFFPDSLRLARSLLNPPAGMSGVEFATLKDKHPRQVKYWSLPMYGQQLAAELPVPGSGATFVLALESSPSAPCLLERIDIGTGTVVEVGELRALGALMWELFVGDADFKKDSLALERTALSAEGVQKVASQSRESEPRIVLNDALLGSVGSVLSEQAGRAEAYRTRLKKRRATAQRFLTLWASTTTLSGGPDFWLASLAARTFIEWAFYGTDAPEAWGVVPDLEKRPEKRLQVTRTLALPVFTDVYPRKL